MRGIAASRTDFIARRPGWVAALVLLAAGLALVPARNVRLSADLVGLLPEGSPAAADYRVFLERFGGLEKVFVLILPAAAPGEAAAGRPEPGVRPTDEADLVAAAGLLEEILAASPEVASARAGIGDDDEEFFLRYVAPRSPLLIPGDDWPEAVAERLEPAAIRRRAGSLKAALGTPAGAALGILARSDPLGFCDRLPRSPAGGAMPLDLLTSTFLAPAGDAALVILTPARSEMDPEGGRALLAELEAAYGEVQQQLGAALEFRALGGPLYAAQDERLLRQDLERTLTGSLAATTLLLVAAFGGLALPLAALGPLAVALLWTAGWMGLVSPEITAVSTGFGAVLVGLGVDYGIHCGARFRQAFAADPDAGLALAATLRHSGPGILTSALTTAAGFLVLSLAHFRPLAELGRLVAAGILSILAAVALLGSAALVLVAPRLKPPGTLWRWLGAAVEGLCRLSTARPWAVLAAAAVLTAAAVAHLGALSLDADLRNLRPDDHPAREAEALLVDRFGLGLDTANLVVRGDDPAQTLARAAKAERLLRRDLGPQADISHPGAYLAAGEPLAERLLRLASLPFERAAADLERELLAANLNPRAFSRGIDALRALGRGEDPGAPPPEAWPPWLAEALATDEDGTWGLLRLRLPEGTWPDGPPPALVAELSAAVPGTAVASAAALGAELRSLAGSDLRQLSLLALAAVGLVVGVSFRGRLRYSLLAGLPVVLGSLWTLGLWSALGRSLDLFTLAVLPIMLGIGIDDGLHVVHGARRDPAAGIRGAAVGAGRALVLTTLTTAVGFGSLLLSHIPGLRNGGLLIATGVAACLLATVLVLPAIEAAGGAGRRSKG